VGGKKRRKKKKRGREKATQQKKADLKTGKARLNEYGRSKKGEERGRKGRKEKQPRS